MSNDPEATDQASTSRDLVTTSRAKRAEALEVWADTVNPDDIDPVTLAEIGTARREIQAGQVVTAAELRRLGEAIGREGHWRAGP